MKPFYAPFFNYFVQPSPPPIAKSKSLLGVLRGQLPNKKWSQPFLAGPYMITLKSPPQPICSSKSHKYDNYDKTTYKVPHFC